jgi:hypothetical protein
MIKFFRKIRQNMIKENKISKYMLYAIGEIILVVIGILIALSINNWNTNKAIEKGAYNQLLEVQKETLNNILSFDKGGSFYLEKMRVIRRVFSDTLVMEDYQENRMLSNVIPSYPYIETQNEAFNKLAQNADNLPDQYKPLISELKNFYNISGFETAFKELMDIRLQNFELTKDFNESMYRNELDAYYDFLLTSKDYKNQLADFSFTLTDVVTWLVDKKYQGIEIYKQMIALGFPDNDMPQIAKMYVTITPETTKPFIGRYTNTIDTVSISYKDKNFVGVGDRTNKLLIRDTSTLVINNKEYLEFNDDMSMFFILLNRNKPHYKRIQEDN